MSSKRRQRHIGLLHPRLALTIALLPISAGLMAAWGAMAAETLGPRVAAFFFGVLFAIPTLTFYWGSLLIWWPTVYWTPEKRSMVGFWSGGLIFGLFVAALVVGEAEEPASIALLCLISGVGSGVAMGLTFAKLYAEPRAPEPEPIPCPACGANLRGQRGCRCKSCGKQFTLGELAAAHVVAQALGMLVEDELKTDTDAEQQNASERAVDVSR